MKKETIVLFPFMSQGHLNPFLALALQLEQKGYSIIFVNTPLNIKKLKRSLPSKSSVQLLQIPFNSSDHGLPPDSENTDDLPYNLVLRLLDVSFCLEQPFREVLADLVDGKRAGRPLCVIGDFFFGWSADVAHEFGIFHAVFSGAGGFGLACYYSMWLNLPHRDNDKGEFLLPDFSEAGKFHVSQLSPSLLIADGSDPFSIFQQKCLPTWGNSDGFLFNTVEELDKIGLVYFRRKLGIPVWAIGPIFLPIDDHERWSSKPVAGLGITPEQCIQFLDSKSENSVLYISFGLQTTISASQMMQLAKALDAGETNFIWVVRPPVGFDINADFKAEEWLPEGFVQRIKDEKKGVIVEKWAPQWQILSHKSTGAFLSHCGWNSVLESLSNGVPLIGWPIAGDQFNNAKLLAEWTGVCLEVARGVNFEVRHEDIRDKIEMVMGNNNNNNNNNIYYNNNNRGKEIRRKACEVREMIKENIRDEENYKGPSIVAMEEFLNLALQMNKETAAGDGDEEESLNN